MENNDISEEMKIPNYELHLNSNGKGKGVAAYFNQRLFRPDVDIKKPDMQLSKFTSSSLDTILLYRSQSANFSEINQEIESLTNREKPQLVIGDFNFCYLTHTSNATRNYLLGDGFTQLIQEPTHIDGHLLDQAYLRDIDGILNCKVEVQSKYYTDHKGLAIVIKKVCTVM